MSIRTNTPCDCDGFCPYEATYNCDCEYWCGSDSDADYEPWEEDGETSMN